MKRVLVVAVLLAAAALPAIALAKHPASPGVRKAVVAVAVRAHVITKAQGSCARVFVSSVNRRWASLSFPVHASPRCQKEEASGVDFFHYTNGRWHFVTGGSSFRCPIPGVPDRVANDLAGLSGHGSPRHLSDFLSPDRKIWCVLQDSPGLRQADCVYEAHRSIPSQEYGAVLYPKGKLVTCAWHPGQNPLDVCVQNWDPSAPVLSSGHVDVIYQYRCQATRTAITCKVDTGKGKGKGFTISGTGVAPIP